MKRAATLLSLAILAATTTATWAQSPAANAVGGRGGRAGAAAGAGAGAGNAAGGNALGGAGARAGGRGPNGPPMSTVPGVDTNFYTNEYNTLISNVLLPDEQRPAVQDKVDTMNKELDALVQASLAQPAAGRGVRGAGTRGPAATNAPSAALTPEQAKLQDDYLALADAHQVKIDATLTAEQKTKWETFKLTRLINPRLQNIALSADQQTKLHELVGETVAAIGALADGKDLEKIKGRFFRRLTTDVLTESQAAQWLEGSNAPPPGGRGGPGGPSGGALAGGTGVATGGAGARGAAQGAGAGAGFGAGGGPGAGGGRGGRGGRGGGGGGGVHPLPGAGDPSGLP